jgi:ABC-type lipoprotein release transport system permease subunit
VSIFLKIAWRNLLRNKRRSAITLAGIAFALTLLIFFQALIDGSNQSMLDNTIQSGIGHIQIHARGYLEEPSVDLAVPNPARVISVAENAPEREAVAPRVYVGGLISSAEKSVGGRIIGIDPGREATVSMIDDAIVQGSYLAASDSGLALIGKRLAQILGVDLGEKIVVVVQAADGSLGAEAYRVKGLFQMNTPDLDKATVYITLKDAQRLAVLPDAVSEIVLVLRSDRRTKEVRDWLVTKLGDPQLEVVTWRQVVPFLVLAVEIRNQFSFIVAAVVATIAAFGILNTFLMAVFERVREFGVMMALGTKPRWVVLLVVLETVVMVTVGVAFGTTFGVLISKYYEHKGIRISGLEEIAREINLNLGTVLYTELMTLHLVVLVGIVYTVSLLAVLYPSIKAARLRPVEALRYI